MFSDQEVEFSLNEPAKCLDAVRADRTEARFVVGTCSLDENNLHVLRFHSELNEFGIDGVLPLPSAVGSICTSPSDKSLVLTGGEDNSAATLWKIPEDIVDKSDELEYKPEEDAASDDIMMSTTSASEDAKSASTLTALATLNHDARLSQMLWQKDCDENCNETPGPVLTLDSQGGLTQWDLSGGVARSMRTESWSLGAASNTTAPRMAVDPHNEHAMCVTRNNSVQIIDWRADTTLPLGMVSDINCHRYGVTDVDYNPNKPYVLATSGQDSLVKFWDLRFRKHPLLVARGGHSHWVSNVKYNPFHDQLVVSTGTDAVVNLWRVSTISSAPLLQLDEENDEDLFQVDSIPKVGGSSGAANVRVARYEHVDSVYDMAWGAADAWVYVTVGYDGKVVLNHVPSNEKYKILL